MNNVPNDMSVTVSQYLYRIGAVTKQVADRAWITDAEEFSSCINEQRFKMQFIKKYLSGKKKKAFCIETEETYGGFPDVLLFENGFGVNPVTYPTLLEFKYADKSGAITFKPTQPAFYKKYNWIPIYVVAFNGKSNKVHIFATYHLRDVRSPYYTEGKARINLSKVEKGFNIL